MNEARIEAERDADGDEYFVPYVRYTYTARGDLYEGRRLAFHPKGSSSYERLAELLTGVVAGTAHRVYYHRKHPWISVLKPGAGPWNYVMLAVLFVAMVVALYVQDRSA